MEFENTAELTFFIWKNSDLQNKERITLSQAKRIAESLVNSGAMELKRRKSA